jgi:hypothetical protein
VTSPRYRANLFGDSSQSLGATPHPLSTNLPTFSNGLKLDRRNALMRKSKSITNAKELSSVIKNISVKSATWKEIILAIFESTLLVDIGQLGDIFFPFTEVTFLGKAH